MASPDTLERHGYKSLFRSNKFELWKKDDKHRLYANVYDPPTVNELEDTTEQIKKAEFQDHSPVDLITDHNYMTNAERVPAEDQSFCFEQLFDKLDVRFVVRICQADKCGLCLETDSEFLRNGKGRLLGRAPNFEAAEGLLDNQGEA